MINPYQTVAGPATAELEVKRSRFISHVAHVTTEDEAIGFRHGIREAIPEASHYVSAYVLREDNLVRFSDAKEPAGTAGMPVLNVIQHLGLMDVVCVVARIFGGTLLGRGGLIRAYTKAAQLAFDQARIVTMAPCRDMLVSVEYPLYERLAHMLEERGVQVMDAGFADDVTLEVRVLSEDVEPLQARIAELCGGRVEFLVGDETFDMVETPLRDAGGNGSGEASPPDSVG